MRSNVTAILVAKHLGERLDETVAALKAQDVAPERVIVIAAGSEVLATHLGSQGFDAVIRVNPKLSFGAAVAAAVQGTDPLDGTAPEWLWLLAEDSAPEHDALAHLLLSVRTTGTAAVAGPKLVDWDDPSLIIELSQGLTWSGARWVLDRQELDQQQYDHYEDVLGVGPVGMLVRRDVWNRLDGFDPALPVYDDGLDLSVRARLAGYRVVVAPEARLRFARTGVAGPEINHRASVLQRAHRRSRTASLYRRIAYAPALAAPFMWLGLPVLGLLGMLWALIRERPGTMLSELWAALFVFVRPGSIYRSRRKIRALSSAGWNAVRPLRADRKTVRSVLAVRREAILTAQGRGRAELQFIRTGGLALTIAATLVSVALTWWLIGASFVTGGGTGQLSASLRDLWAGTISAAAVDIQSLGSFADTIPADPFTWVLALLGTITFWNPSFAIILLIMAAIPVAALGGWMWAARLTEHGAGRLLGGIAWALAPVFLTAIVTGRLSALVLGMVLPWACYAASKAPRSWSWAGVTSFLVAVALAAAPSLIPAAAIVLLVGICMRPQSTAKFLATPIVAIVLFAPKLLGALATGNLASMLIDPGTPLDSKPVTLGELALGFPEPGLGGIDTLLAVLGPGEQVASWIIVVSVLAPLATLALLGALTGQPKRTIPLSVLALTGLSTAVLAPQFAFIAEADGVVHLWAGSGLMLYWMAVVSFAVIATNALGPARLAVAIVAMIGVLAVAIPAGVRLMTADTAVHADRQPVPAVMNAELRTNPDAQALVVKPLEDERVRARLVGADSLVLDRVRTTLLAQPHGEADDVLAELLGALSSVGVTGLADPLTDAGITFIMLEESSTADATQLRSLMQDTFDQNDALSPVGSTAHGLLWRVNEVAAAEGETVPEGAVDAAPLAEDALDIHTAADQPVSGHMLWIAQLVLMGLVFLLALPTGEVRERPMKRTRRRWRRGIAVVPVAPEASALPDAQDPTDARILADDVTAVDETTMAGESTTLEPVTAEPDDVTGEIPVVAEGFDLPDEDTIFVGQSGTVTSVVPDPTQDAPDDGPKTREDDRDA